MGEAKIIKVYKDKQTKEQISYQVALPNGAETTISHGAIEGLIQKFGCSNAMWVSGGNGRTGYISGKSGHKLDITEVDIKEREPRKPRQLGKGEDYVEVWDADTETIFADVMQAIATTAFKQVIRVRSGNAFNYFMRDYPDLQRRTIDIDFDVFTWERWEQLVEQIEDILNTKTRKNIEYKLLRRGKRGANNSDKLKLESTYRSKRTHFDIDMNVRFSEGVPWEGSLDAASIYSMISDKLSVLATDRILVRPKDMYDIYAYSFVDRLLLGKIIEAWQSDNRGKVPHPYIFQEGVVGKVFDELAKRDRYKMQKTQAVLNRVSSFIRLFYVAINSDNGMEDVEWNSGSATWERQ